MNIIDIKSRKGGKNMKILNKLIAFSLTFVLILQSISCAQNSANNNLNVNGVTSKVNNENFKNVKLKYMGQATVRIITEDNKVIYVDPFAGDDYSMPADLILQTHSHFDHADLEKVSNRNQGCIVITEKEAIVNAKHQTFDLPFVKVVPVEAGYNQNHDVNSCVGYVLEFKNGIKVYLSGDTSKTNQMSEMASMNIDYAFFCTDGKFNMDNNEAAECAKLVNAKHNIPYHNDTSNSGIRFDRKKAEEWTAPNKLIINVNEEIELKAGEEKNNMGNSKTLVIYSSFIGEQYSVGVIEKGNTEIVADMIIENLAADRYKVEPKNDIYPRDSYKKLTEIASKELHDSARPEIKDITFDISNYDTIFVGAPVWWGDFPMIMYTLFDKVDMNGKTIVPFSTHGGSGLSGFDSKLKRLYPNAKVLKGLAITGTDTQSRKDKVKNEVEKWIKEVIN